VLGHSHALSGAVAGTAAGAYLLHAPLSQTALLAGLTAGFATLSDLDSTGSCAARSLGFLSIGFAHLVRLVAGGHRHGTHSALGVAVFTAAAWAACSFRYSLAGHAVLGAFLALAIAAGLRALRLGGHSADLMAIGGAAVLAWSGWGLALVPLACGLGCATHVLGDMLTDEGCPVAWPLSPRHFRLWPEPLAFTTGTRPELWCVTPVLSAALLALGWHAAAVL
jgi:membrane-bound metal-dependent hydrolase YbcI (DUF457 family)